jgi:hypothetical protein
VSEIRKALDAAYEWGKREANTPYPCSDNIRTEYEVWRDDQRLLPPEGETRGDESDTWDLVTWLQVQARASALPYKTCKRLNDAAEEILKLRAEPAPSSEKALRARCEALAASWDATMGREDFAPSFAEELREILASSPAPEAPK